MKVSFIEIIAGAILLVALGGVAVRAVKQAYQKYKQRDEEF